MSNSFDKNSTLNIDGEVLNRSSFAKTFQQKLSRRVINDIDYDRIDLTYPSPNVEVHTYTLNGNTVKTITLTYLTNAKKDLLNVVYT